MTGIDSAAVRRTWVFAAALTLLLVSARSGASALTIQVWFTLFVVAATLWVRGQYVDSLDDRQWLISRRTLAVLLAVAVALVMSYQLRPRAGAAFAGVLLAYFVAGATLARLRQGTRSPAVRRSLALGLTSAGAVCALLGTALFGHSSGTAGVILEYVLLGAALLVLLPVGVTLLSEVVIRWMCRLSGPWRLRLWFGLAGAVLFVLATALLYALTRSPWLLGAVIVLALLVVAVVSTTQADVAFVLSVIALLGVTPPPADVPADLVPDRTASSLLMCLAPGTCSSRSRLWTGALEQVRRNLRDTYRQLDAVFPDSPVVAVGYPDPIDLSGRCDDVALAPRERRFLHDFVTKGLNRVVAETAAEFGFHYLAEMESSLRVANLQLCDQLNEGRPGLNFIGIRSVGGVAEQRFHPKNFSHSSLHPNERGHAAMLRTFQTWLPDLASLPARGPVTKPATEVRDAGVRTVSTTGSAAQCDVLSASTDGCRTQGMQWAKGRVRMLLLTQGWLGLLPLAGVWLAAVAFFGARRRRLADRRR